MMILIQVLMMILIQVLMMILIQVLMMILIQVLMILYRFNFQIDFWILFFKRFLEECYLAWGCCLFKVPLIVFQVSTLQVDTAFAPKVQIITGVDDGLL
jgi:hypothetical protein